MKKTVLITGATKGIGLATTNRLIKKNYQVIGIARENSNVPYPGIFFSCDLGNIEKTQKTIEEIKKLYPINIIVNNVGITLPQSLEELDLRALHTVYDLNVRTAVQITQAFIENMKNNKFGRIVNIASRSIDGAKNRSSFSAAKNALIGLTRTWALEFAEFGITVNAIAPGGTETESLRETRPVGSAAEEELLASIPVKRLARPDEIAAGIEYFISDDAGFVTGQTLFIDGGASI